MHFCHSGRWLLLVAFVGSCAADLAAQVGQNRPPLEVRLRSPFPAERAEALREVKVVANANSIRPLLTMWSTDPNQEVRAVAADVLYKKRGDPAFRNIYLAMLKNEINEASAVLVGIWLAGTNVEDHGEMAELLARRYEKRATALSVLIPTTDFLGTRDDGDAVKALSALTQLPIFRAHYAFSRSVVQALIAIQRPEAVATLVDLLAGCEGEVAADIALHLTRISGEPFGLDAAAWKKWWSIKKTAFEFPAPNVQKLRQLAVGDRPSYYGIAVFGKKVIFVVDTSGSMKGDRIRNAKLELTKVVDSLETRAAFNIVGFSSSLNVWQKSLQPAGAESKSKAAGWVNKLVAKGGTFTYDALKAALDQQPEVIFILTDGEPTGGTYVEPSKILDAIAQTNRYRRTTINVIGLNPGPEDGTAAHFLKDLAARNFGQYRRVD